MSADIDNNVYILEAEYSEIRKHNKQVNLSSRTMGLFDS